MACEIHLGDIGTAFRLTIVDCDGQAIDVSGASVKSIVFLKPDKTTVTRPAVLFTDGVDGVIEYISVADDLDQLKTWKIQSVVTLPTGTWSSNIEKFKVHDNL